MKVLMIAPIGKAGGVSTHSQELVRELRGLGIMVEVYNVTTSIKPRFIANFIKFYKRSFGVFINIFIRRGFDIVHVQASGPMGGFLPAISAAIVRKIVNFPLVVTFHYSRTSEFIIKNKFFKFVMESSKFFIVVSKNQKNIIINEINYIEKVKVISNGFNPKNLFPIDCIFARKYLSLPYNKKVIFHVSNLLPVKGQKYLIIGMKKILEKRKDVLLFIGGKGPLKHELQKQIIALKLEDNIKLLGFIPDDKLALWMNAADLFVLPSLSEGNPTVMFESLGVGLPFVGTRVGGVPEIITSDEYGLLAEPGNPDDLAEKILVALEKEWDREKIRDYARQFTWENIAKQVMKVYEEVLSKSPSGE